MIVSELRQLSGCFPKSSTVHGRPECAAAQDLSSICLRDSFIVIAADLSRRAGPWGGLGSVGMPTIGKKLGHAGHVGRRGPTVSMTCDMRRLSFDARKTPLGGILDQPAAAPGSAQNSLALTIISHLCSCLGGPAGGLACLAAVKAPSRSC